MRGRKNSTSLRSRSADIRFLFFGVAFIVAGTYLYLTRVHTTFGMAFFASYFISSFWWGSFTFRRVFPKRDGPRTYLVGTGEIGAFIDVIYFAWLAVVLVIWGAIGLVSAPIEFGLGVRRILRNTYNLPRTPLAHAAQEAEAAS